MPSFPWDLALFIATLGVLITVHEFGHFWAARRCDVRIERFSIGSGRALWRRADKLGTEYAVILVPLSGYVKMLGERAEPVVSELHRHAFNNKSVGQRAVITAAGPVTNFIFAIFTYWLVFIISVSGVRPMVGEIAANSIAAEAQVTSSTELKVVDGIKTPDWDVVRLQLANKIGDESTIITVAPFGSDRQRNVKLDLRRWALEPDKEDPVSSLGIHPRGPQIEPVLENVQPNSAASKAGLQAGDRIVKADGQPLVQWMTFVMPVQDNLGKSLALEIGRQESPLSLVLILESKPDKDEVINFVDIEPKVVPLSDRYKVVRQYGSFDAIVGATDKAWQLMKLAVSMLGKLIIGNVKLNNLSGSVSIAKGIGMTAELGVVYYSPFLTLTSMNLGVVNLFPLPVLDGEHLLFLVTEKIKDGPVSERVQDFCYRIGSILLVLLTGLAPFSGFSRL